MEKKTYKDLKDGDIVYVVDGAEGFEELTVKIREENHPQMIENEEYDELCYFLELFYQDGTKYNYYCIHPVEEFKDATNTNDYDCFDELWGLVCFFNREDAVEYYKKSIKDIVDALNKEIENFEKQRCKYVEILNSFE